MRSSRGVSARAARRPVAARRRSRGLAWRARLGPPVHLRAPAHGGRPGRGDRDDRAPCAARAGGRAGRPALERRADAPAPNGRSRVEPPAHARRDRGRHGVPRRARARPERRPGRPRRGTRARAARHPPSLTRRRAGLSGRAGTSAAVTEYPVRRNTLLLASGLICLSGMFQLTVAVATVTLVLVTGVKGILGLGPAIFLVSGALAAGPAGRAMDRYGRMPIIRIGFLAGIVGCSVTAAGCALDTWALVLPGLALAGGCGGVVQLSREAAAEMYPPERRARGMSYVLFGSVIGAVLGPFVFGPMFAGKTLTPDDLVVPWLAAGAFLVAGLVIAFFVRPDPSTIARQHGDSTVAAAPLAEILRRPGVPLAMVAAV